MILNGDPSQVAFPFLNSAFFHRQEKGLEKTRFGSHRDEKALLPFLFSFLLIPKAWLKTISLF